MGCRCPECKRANSDYQKEIRYRLNDTEPPFHGTTHIYQMYGCRCDECRAAIAAASRKYIRKNPDYHKEWQRNKAKRLKQGISADK